MTHRGTRSPNGNYKHKVRGYIFQYSYNDTLIKEHVCRTTEQELKHFCKSIMRHADMAYLPHWVPECPPGAVLDDAKGNRWELFNE